MDDKTKEKVIRETRTWILWNCFNGEMVRWGSTNELKPTMTVKKLEEFALELVEKILKEPKI